MERPIRQSRRPKSYTSPFTTKCLHLRNPWVTAWWSAALPGLGHISLGDYIKGFILVGLELFINISAHLNQAILYYFTGQFDLGRAIVDDRWLLSYPPIYIYAIWNSYQLTVELNKLAILAHHEQPPLKAVAIGSTEINFLTRRNPWVAAIWSLLTPGLGQIYCHRIPNGFFLLLWWMCVCYHANLGPAIQFSALGLFEQAKTALNPTWIMFLPSLYGYACFDAYSITVEYNKLFKIEQAQFLQEHYQDTNFDMPV